MNVQAHSERTSSRASGRSTHLRAATHAAHEALDKRIMSADPFGEKERYVRFLRVQHAFHRVIDHFYSDPELHLLVPDIVSRRRLPLIRRDLVDLGEQPPLLGAQDDYLIDLPTVLGWLYVAEGSNLGAAFLLKEAQKLGLSESFGARHLAGSHEGRGLHWRKFTAALDAVKLGEAEEERVIKGAREAFERVYSLVDEILR